MRKRLALGEFGAAGRCLLVALWLLGGAGCAKRVGLAVDDVNIADGREFEVAFKGDRLVRGRFVSGAAVGFKHGDSLFTAEVGDVTDEFVGLTNRVLILERGWGGDWTDLRTAAEDANTVVERPLLGNALLARDEIDSVSLITIDRRRTVAEAVFWAALAIAAGFAGFAR